MWNVMLAPLRLVMRFGRAVRYWQKLRYSWHLSWVKAWRA